MNNAELISRYDSIYKKGSSTFYTFNNFQESRLILDMIPAWQGLNVLEIGCGEGRLAAMMSFAGAQHVDALDYSAEAIKIATRRFNLETVTFKCADYKTLKEMYDVVVLQGVLEHLDKPFDELAHILNACTRENGIVITSSPSFINPRGYVWMTLQLLFKVPMSLSDLHFLCPADFEEFAKAHGYDLVMKSCDQDWGGGERLLVDFRKRLPNALRDAGMDASGVDHLMAWLARTLPYQPTHEYSGANIVYKLTKSP
ncbi:MAG: class I SAM-dependent methyltransferase [Kiritimatiellae bacterium]|nr:class I SAM-dependent methyltransferase [Kiritimatiellia bacterium]MDD5522688.1 class I SAM-dependent methyltransferase [Kiritimatiellia bacterium]